MAASPTFGPVAISLQRKLDAAYSAAELYERALPLALRVVHHLVELTAAPLQGRWALAGAITCRQKDGQHAILGFQLGDRLQLSVISGSLHCSMGDKAPRSDFYLLYCKSLESDPSFRKARDHIFECLQDSPWARNLRYHTVAGYTPPVIAVDVSKLNMMERGEFQRFLSDRAGEVDFEVTDRYFGDRVKGDRLGSMQRLSVQTWAVPFGFSGTCLLSNGARMEVGASTCGEGPVLFAGTETGGDIPTSQRVLQGLRCVLPVLADALSRQQMLLGEIQVHTVLESMFSGKGDPLLVKGMHSLLKRLPLCDRASFSAPARWAPASDRKGALVKTVNQDELIKVSSLPIPHLASCYFQAAFVKAIELIRTCLERVHGSKRGGTTAVAGIVHIDPAIGKRVLSYMNLGDSKLYAFSGLATGQKPRLLFQTTEHTPSTETGKMGVYDPATGRMNSYFMLGTTLGVEHPSEINRIFQWVFNIAVARPEYRAILMKCCPVENGQPILPQPDQYAYVFNVGALTEEERRIFLTRIFNTAEDFYGRRALVFKAYCIPTPVGNYGEHGVAPTRVLGDFGVAAFTHLKPDTGSVELPTDEDVWVLATSDGVSEPLDAEAIQAHLQTALAAGLPPTQYLQEKAEALWFKMYPTAYSDDISATLFHLEAGAELEVPVELGGCDGHGTGRKGEGGGEVFSRWAANALSVLVPALALALSEGRWLTTDECAELAASLALETDPLDTSTWIEEILLAGSWSPMPGAAAAATPGAGAAATPEAWKVWWEAAGSMEGLKTKALTSPSFSNILH